MFLSMTAKLPSYKAIKVHKQETNDHLITSTMTHFPRSLRLTVRCMVPFSGMKVSAYARDRNFTSVHDMSYFSNLQFVSLKSAPLGKCPVYTPPTLIKAKKILTLLISSIRKIGNLLI